MHQPLQPSCMERTMRKINIHGGATPSSVDSPTRFYAFAFRLGYVVQLVVKLAEEEGFAPTSPIRTDGFQDRCFYYSATLPVKTTSAHGMSSVRRFSLRSTWFLGGIFAIPSILPDLDRHLHYLGWATI